MRKWYKNICATKHDHINHLLNVSKAIGFTYNQLYFVVYRLDSSIAKSGLNGIEDIPLMPPEPPISERCAIDGLAHTEAEEEPALVVVHTPFLGRGAGQARQVGLPADVIDQYRAAPAGLLLVACAHHGRALAGMVQEHDRTPGIHAANHLRHGATGVLFLDMEPTQRIQHHQAADRKSTRLNSSHQIISYAV